jgi:broad specificity phosphatase PhoE
MLYFFKENKHKLFYITPLFILIFNTIFFWKNIKRKLIKILENSILEEKKRRKPKRLIFIRHGESQGNIDPNIYFTIPDNKIALTENGKSQAVEASKKLKDIIKDEKVKFIYSPFMRTKQTLENILKIFDKNKIVVQEDPRIREQEWGNFQDENEMKKINEERRKCGRFYYRFPTGESGADVYDRVSNFLCSFYRGFNVNIEDSECSYKKIFDNIVIVSHGLFIRLFLMRYFRWTVDKFEKLDNPSNCEIIVLEKNEEDIYQIVSKNLMFENILK